MVIQEPRREVQAGGAYSRRPGMSLKSAGFSVHRCAPCSSAHAAMAISSVAAAGARHGAIDRRGTRSLRRPELTNGGRRQQRLLILDVARGSRPPQPFVQRERRQGDDVPLTNRDFQRRRRAPGAGERIDEDRCDRDERSSAIRVTSRYGANGGSPEARRRRRPPRACRAATESGAAPRADAAAPRRRAAPPAPCSGRLPRER